MCLQQHDPDLDKKQSDLSDLCLLPSYVTGGMFVDTFRYLHPDQTGAYTNWCTLTGARQTNFGRRLDYILCDSSLAHITLTDCVIMAMVQGSDHCPVQTTFDFVVVTALRRPSLCAKLMPEFAGQQQKLSMFFTKSSEFTERIPEAKSESLTLNDVNVSDDKNSLNLISKSSLESSVVSLKRQLSSDLKGQSKKKKSKISSDKTSKQTSLMGFFNRNNSLTKALNPVNETSAESLSSLSNIVDAKVQFQPSALNEQFETSDGEISSSQESQSDSSNARSTDNSQSESQNGKKINNPQVSAWKLLMKGPPPAPLCSQHKELCVLRTVKKAGSNRGKQFYTCARPEGAVGNPEARCNYFVWVKDLKNWIGFIS